MSSRRTMLEFDSDADLWTVVEGWAKETGYRQVDSGDSWRRYQKGHGILTGSMLLEVRREDNKWHLDAWIHANIMARIGALFLIPSEMSIQSGGLKGAVPRRIARRDVNALLQRLGQQPIE